jgi:sugar lactone lactonase YvrE
LSLAAVALGVAGAADALMAPGTITTVAGSTYGFSGDGGPATEARLRQPRAVAFDPVGNAYVADTLNHRIRRIDQHGVITTVAGEGTKGYGGDGGPALQARLHEPHGVALDGAGNLYICDSKNNRVRKVDRNGIITTVAGDGAAGYGGDGGAATQAHLADPKQIAIGADRFLYIGDVDNHRVRRLDLVSGVLTTVAGDGVAGYGGDGSPAIHARINGHCGVGVAADGTLYIADQGNHRVRKVDTNGIITTVAGTGRAGSGGDGGSATRAQLNLPRAVAVDDAGNLFIAEEAGQRVRKVDTRGVITTVAGTGRAGYSGDAGPATAAQINAARGVALDPHANLWIADSFNNRVRMVTRPA